MRHIIYFLLLFFAGILSAQVSISVQTEKGRREFSENEPILINVILEVRGKDLFQQTPLRLFSTVKFEVLGSGTEQSSYFDEKTGFFVSQTHYQTLLKAKKSGKYKIGSASVEVNDKLYYTEPFDIQINEGLFASENRNELSLKLSVNNKFPYQNEKVMAVVTAYSKNLDAFKKIKKITLPNHHKIKVLHSDFSKEMVERNDDLHSQVVAVFTFVPEASGVVKIPSVLCEMNTNLPKLLSNSVELQVKNIPPPDEDFSTKVVGNYRIDLKLDTVNKPIVGKPYSVFVMVKGEGNIEEELLPKLKKNPKYQVFAPKVSHSKGNVSVYTLEYVLLPKVSGKMFIEIEPFTFFNPKTEKYEQAKPRKLMIDSEKEEVSRDLTSTIDKVSNYTQGTLKINPSKNQNHQKQKGNDQPSKYLIWTVTTGILLVCIIMIFRFKNKKKIQSKSIFRPTKSDVHKKITAYIDEMFLSVTSKNFDGYFDIYQQLSAFLQEQYSVGEEEMYFNLIEKECGRKLAERYKDIHQKIHFEKFAPHHETEHFYELTTELQSVLHQWIMESTMFRES